MNISITEIKAVMTRVLKAKSYAEDDIPFIINMYLGGELRGHTSHGLASFAGFVQEDFSKLDEPEVIKETHSLFMLDAKSHSGNVIGKRAADEAIKRARAEIVGVSIVKNMDSWLRPGAIAEYIADQGMVAYVVNSGGGASIAPPGGYEAAVGTNPIAYGIPMNNSEPLVVDMATAKRAWGQVRLANKYGTDLPPDTFYDAKGNVTLDPKKACSVMPAGGYKGFSLALMIEIICGSLVGMPMMVNSNNAGSSFGVRIPDRGGLIFVIDPAQTVGLDEFKTANSDLIEKIKATHPLPGETVRIPGEQAGNKKAASLKSDTIDITQELWEEIKSL